MMHILYCCTSGLHVTYPRDRRAALYHQSKVTQEEEGGEAIVTGFVREDSRHGGELGEALERKKLLQGLRSSAEHLKSSTALGD